MSTPNDAPPVLEGASILIVDDDATLRERLAMAFVARGLDARTAGSYDEALLLAQAEPPELAVVDLRMPGRTGLELERVRWEHINRVLSDCEGNVSEAARRLRMHRRTLQRILQKYPPRK